MGDPEHRDESGQGAEELRPPFSIIEPASDRDPGEPAAEPMQKPDGVEVPLVLPGHGGPSFWRRRGRRISRLALIALVLSTVWVLYDRLASGRGEPAPAFSSVSDSGVTPELRSLAEGFQTVLSRYGERREDFDLGRLPCQGLWTGYRAVDESFMSLSEQYATGRGEAADQLYEDSKRSMEDVERHFDASGCPRRN